MTGTVTEPSPPSATGTAPLSTIRVVACSIRAKASRIRPGVSLTLPQSTTPSAVKGSKSACVGLKRRISGDCKRTASGPLRAPTAVGHTHEGERQREQVFVEQARHAIYLLHKCTAADRKSNAAKVCTFA